MLFNTPIQDGLLPCSGMNAIPPNKNVKLTVKVNLQVTKMMNIE